MILLAPSNGFAYDTYSIVGENYSYRFDIYHSGEPFKMGDDSMISTFDLSQELRLPIFTSARSWAEVLKTNAETPYRVTNVNAVINNLTITGYADGAEDSPVSSKQW